VSDDAVEDEPNHLIRRARAGDDAALTSLLEGYRPYLALLARVHIRRHLQAKLDGSDLVQETMIPAHRDFSSFRGVGEKELTAWLRAMMAHLGANLLRHYQSRRRDVRLEQAWEDQLDQSSVAIGQVAADPASSPSQKAEHRERAVLVADALARLPASQREVVILHEFEGKTIAQIAEPTAVGDNRSRKEPACRGLGVAGACRVNGGVAGTRNYSGEGTAGGGNGPVCSAMSYQLGRPPLP
jgi:RNA polymerase sigma-70 factor, ECF subfamily